MPPVLEAFVNAHASAEFDSAYKLLKPLLKQTATVDSFTFTRTAQLFFIWGDPTLLRIGLQTLPPDSTVLPNLLTNKLWESGTGPKLVLIANESIPQEKWLGTFRFVIGKFLLSEAFESRGMVPAILDPISLSTLDHLYEFEAGVAKQVVDLNKKTATWIDQKAPSVQSIALSRIYSDLESAFASAIANFRNRETNTPVQKFPGANLGPTADEKLKALTEKQVAPLFEQLLRIFQASQQKLNKVDVALPQNLASLKNESVWKNPRGFTGRPSEGDSLSARSIRGDIELFSEIENLNKALDIHEGAVQKELQQIIDEARVELIKAIENLQ